VFYNTRLTPDLFFPLPIAHFLPDPADRIAPPARDSDS
jgi:hypothetical protein